MTASPGNPVDSHPDSCYGIDIADDGTVVVAERLNGMAAASSRYSAGEAGVVALREHISGNAARTRVCILSRGAAALAVALGLAPLPHSEIMLVAPRAIESSGRNGRETAAASIDERARRLSRLAEHLY